MFSREKRRVCARGNPVGLRHGAAALEFAVVLPIYVMIVFAIVEFGRAFSVQQQLNNAARIGARRSIVDSATNTDVEQAVKAICAGT